MSLSLHIRQSLELPAFIVSAFLQDLTDDELFVRPADGMNHIAWQIGHLICNENSHIDAVSAGWMPALPDDFTEQHTKETAKLDDRACFCSKVQYLELAAQQRSATLALLAKLSDVDLLGPSPDSLRYFGPTLGCVFSGEATHWMMHAGQWSVVRRILGRPPLF